MAYRLARQAERELDDIWYYTVKESGSVDIADRFIESLTERFYLLAKTPHIGQRRDKDLRVGLRSFPLGRYVVIYRLDGADVFILHVVHGNRNIDALLRSF